MDIFETIVTNNHTFQMDELTAKNKITKSCKGQVIPGVFVSLSQLLLK